MRYQGKRSWRYEREVSRFAKQYTLLYAFQSPGEGQMSATEVVSTVKALAKRYGADEKMVVADVIDASNRYVDENIRLGPNEMLVPRIKTQDEFLSEGRPDLAAERYPEGGTIEEVLLLEDESPE